VIPTPSYPDGVLHAHNLRTYEMNRHRESFTGEHQGTLRNFIQRSFSTCALHRQQECSADCGSEPIAPACDSDPATPQPTKSVIKRSRESVSLPQPKSQWQDRQSESGQVSVDNSKLPYSTPVIRHANQFPMRRSMGQVLSSCIDKLR